MCLVWGWECVETRCEKGGGKDCGRVVWGWVMKAGVAELEHPGCSTQQSGS